MSRRTIVLVTLGGTISTAGHHGGSVVRRMGRADHVGLDGFAPEHNLAIRDFAPTVSSNLTFAGTLDAVRVAEDVPRWSRLDPYNIDRRSADA